MTIGSQLDALAAAKASIKTSIEGKGVTVGDAPLSQYASKIDAIVGEGGGIQPNTVIPRKREVDWLTMPEIGEGVTGCNILMAVFSFTTECSFTFKGDYTVDWGDGSPVESFSSGSTATHKFNYEGSVDTNSGRSYRQCIIKVTPQAGHELWYVDLAEGALVSAGAKQNSFYLDVDMQISGSSGDTTVIRVSGDETGKTTAILMEIARVVALAHASPIDFSSAFQGANSLHTLKLNTNNRSAIDCSYMFRNCSALQEIPPFNTTGMTAAASMFSGCRSLAKIPPLDTSLVSVFTSMFGNCSNIVEMPNIDLTRATTIGGMFSGCSSISKIVDYQTPQLLTAGNAFAGCKFAVAPKLNTSLCTDFSYMFSNCSSLTDQPDYDMAEASLSNNMFSGCTSLRSICITNYPKVYNATGMFQNCVSLAYVPQLTFPVSAIKSSMFSGCTALQSMPLWDDAASGNGLATNMYSNCSAISKIDISKTNSGMFNGSNIFLNCSGAVILYARNINANNSVTLGSGLSSLRKVDIDGCTMTLTLNNCPIATNEMNKLFDDLGSNPSYSNSITITGSIAANDNPVVSKTTSSFTAGSNVISVTNTTGLSVGMCSTTATVNAGISVSHSTTTKLFTSVGHSYVNGDVVTVSVSTGGLSTKYAYYVVNATADTFQLARTRGGDPVTTFTATSATLIHVNKIMEIDYDNNKVIMKYPMATTSASTTIAFRGIDTQLAVLKGYTVSG